MGNKKVYHFELQRDAFRDIFDWMGENIPKEHIVRWTADERSHLARHIYGYSLYRIRVSIDDKKSAMLFKLRWINDEG